MNKNLEKEISNLKLEIENISNKISTLEEKAKNQSNILVSEESCIELLKNISYLKSIGIFPINLYENLVNEIAPQLIHESKIEKEPVKNNIRKDDSNIKKENKTNNGLFGMPFMESKSNIDIEENPNEEIDLFDILAQIMNQK